LLLRVEQRTFACLGDPADSIANLNSGSSSWPTAHRLAIGIGNWRQTSWNGRGCARSCSVFQPGRPCPMFASSKRCSLGYRHFVVAGQVGVELGDQSIELLPARGCCPRAGRFCSPLVPSRSPGGSAQVVGATQGAALCFSRQPRLDDRPRKCPLWSASPARRAQTPAGDAT
jgi:hypothetical protein